MGISRGKPVSQVEGSLGSIGVAHPVLYDSSLSVIFSKDRRSSLPVPGDVLSTTSWTYVMTCWFGVWFVKLSPPFKEHNLPLTEIGPYRELPAWRKGFDNARRAWTHVEFVSGNDPFPLKNSNGNEACQSVPLIDFNLATIERSSSWRGYARGNSQHGYKEDTEMTIFQRKTTMMGRIVLIISEGQHELEGRASVTSCHTTTESDIRFWA